jgi:hypothetical protein
MTEDLVLPVPEALAAMYLVPVPMPAQQARRIAGEAVARRIAEPLRSLTMRLIGTPGLAVAARPLSALTSVSAEDLDAAALPAGSDTEFVAFAAMPPPRPGPIHEWLARAAAAAFAADLRLPLVDAFAHQVMHADDALATLPGAPRLRHADGGFRLADWVAVQRVDRLLTTRGLGRFGLPELRLDHVPPELCQPWALALTGLGHRLHELLRRELRRGGETAFVQVPRRIDISRTDVGLAFGLDLHEDGGEALPVRLSLDPATSDTEDSYLAVDAPGDQPAAEHRRTVQAALFRQPATGAGARRERRSPRAAAARTRASAARPRRPG